MKLRTTFCLLLAGILAFGLAAPVMARGGAQDDGGYLRLAWWGNAARDERTIAMVQLFMEKNPGVTVETEPAAWDGYWPKLNTQLAAGSAPDVMQQDYTYIEQYNARNQLLDLNAYVQNGTINLTGWSDSALSSGRLGGKLIAISLGTNAWGMGVDPAVLARAGVTVDDTAWTWADYEKIALAVFQATGVQTMPAGAQEFYQTFEHIVRQFGVPQFAAGGKSLGWTSNAAATAAVKEWFDIQLRLKAAGALYDPQDAFVMGRAMNEYPIAQGKTWNNFHWSNQHIGYQTAANRPLEYYMFPSVNGNKAPFGTYLKPSMFISILSSAENKDLAAKFVNFMLNDLEANRILLAERGIPVPAAVRDDLSSRVDPNMKYLFDYIGKITPYTSPIDPPDPASAGEVYDTMRPLVLRCLLGELTSDAAVSQIIQGANAVLSR